MPLVAITVSFALFILVLGCSAQTDPFDTPAPTQEPTPVVLDLTATPMPTPTSTLISTPMITPTPEPTPTPTLVPTPTPTPTPMPTPAPTPDLGNWVVETRMNPLDDTPTIGAYLYSYEGRGVQGDPIALALWCVSGKVDVYIHWESYLGYSFDNDIHVTTRIGDSPAQELRWNIGNDSKTTTYKPSMMLQTRDGMREFGQPGALTTSDFIYALKNADRFVAQVTPYQEFPITAVFDLTGIQQVTPQVLGRCFAPK